MVFILNSHIWSFFLTQILYNILILSFLLYLIPMITHSHNYTFFKKKKNFIFINWNNINYITFIYLINFLWLNFLWLNTTFSIWFGHVIITNFNLKFLNFIIIMFYLIIYVIVINSYFTSREIYDYIIATINICFWVIILFFLNSIFTTIFIVEVLSANLFLLIITSNYSSTFYFNLTFLSKGVYSQQINPTNHIQSLLFLFWISLISSLSLFFFIILLFLKSYTFDWFLLEYIFLFFIVSNTQLEIVSFALAWFTFLFSIFIKCGLVPFFIWKPIFFKGLPLHMLYVYICFFYFFLYLFIIYLLVIYFSEIYYFHIFVFTLFLIIGLLVLIIILCESYYLKIFLAMSSILNSILVFVALSSPHNIEFLFFL